MNNDNEFYEPDILSVTDDNGNVITRNKDVALRVVEETGGNQTAAAKRLGISRTTLWRLLQK